MRKLLAVAALGLALCACGASDQDLGSVLEAMPDVCPEWDGDQFESAGVSACTGSIIVSSREHRTNDETAVQRVERLESLAKEEATDRYLVQGEKWEVLCFRVANRSACESIHEALGGEFLAFEYGDRVPAVDSMAKAGRAAWATPNEFIGDIADSILSVNVIMDLFNDSLVEFEQGLIAGRYARNELRHAERRLSSHYTYFQNALPASLSLNSNQHHYADLARGTFLNAVNLYQRSLGYYGEWIDAIEYGGIGPSGAQGHWQAATQAASSARRMLDTALQQVDNIWVYADSETQADTSGGFENSVQPPVQDDRGYFVPTDEIDEFADGTDIACSWMSDGVWHASEQIMYHFDMPLNRVESMVESLLILYLALERNCPEVVAYFFSDIEDDILWEVFDHGYERLGYPPWPID